MNQDVNRDLLSEGHKLHWYEIKSVLGRGAFGVTYLARDNNLHQIVAIKEYFPNDFSSRESGSTVRPTTGEKRELYEWGLDRFIREAQTLAQFRHHNIVRVMSVFELNNTAYMVMEYEQGEELSRLYKRKKYLTEQELLNIFLPILDGLKLVHNAGFIHRDIKPENIYIREDGSPVLIDFGAARKTIGTPTRAITSLVTVGYAPFEQYNDSDEKQGPWTDIYALGACLYYATNGRLPVDALARGSNLLSNGIDPYEPVSVLKQGDYSSRFLHAIDHALMFRANERPKDIMTWGDMLKGKIEAPPLPSEWLKQTNSMEDDDDATVVVRRPPRAAQPATVDQTVRQSSEAQTDATNISSPQVASSQISQPQQNRDPQINPSHASGVLLYGTEPVNQPTAEPVPEPIRPDSYHNVITTTLILFVLVITGMIVDVWLESAPVNDVEQYVEQEDVESLLRSATKARSAGNLLDKETGAIYYYQRVLGVDPTNRKAMKQIKDIIELNTDGIRSDLDEGFFEQAQSKSFLLQAAVPDSALVMEVVEEVRTAKSNKQDISQLLQQAQTELDAGNLITPDNHNALLIYRSVVAMDSENTDAVQGIETIITHFGSLAEKSLADGNAIDAEANINDILYVDANSELAEELLTELNSLKTQDQEIDQLLTQAQSAFKSGNFFKPANSNALNLYQRVLKIDRGNIKAKQGLKKLERNLKSVFEKHLSATDFTSAESVMRDIEKAMPGSTFARSTRAEWERNKPASRSDVEIFSDLLGKFKQGFESRNIRALKRMSEFRPGRQEFLQQFFNNYNSFRLKISGVKFIGSERKGVANIAITKLINKYGSPVNPGTWSQFEIEVRRNSVGQWKIYW